MFLLDFYNAYDINLWENNFGRSMAYSWRKNLFIKFHEFVKNELTQLKTTQLKQNILNQWEFMGFCKLHWYFYDFC